MRSFNNTVSLEIFFKIIEKFCHQFLSVYLFIHSTKNNKIVTGISIALIKINLIQIV